MWQKQQQGLHSPSASETKTGQMIRSLLPRLLKSGRRQQQALARAQDGCSCYQPAAAAMLCRVCSGHFMPLHSSITQHSTRPACSARHVACWAHTCPSAADLDTATTWGQQQTLLPDLPRHYQHHGGTNGRCKDRIRSRCLASSYSGSVYRFSSTDSQPALHDYDMQPADIQNLYKSLQPDTGYQERGCTQADITKGITGLPVVWHSAYSTPRLSTGHRFPMQVFGRIYHRLLREGIITASQVHEPPHLPSRQQLCLVHTPHYVDAFRQGKLDDMAARRIGFGAACSSPGVIVRTHAEVAGTLLTARLALQTGLAVNTAGGTHHAFPDGGSGFCILNDLAVTAKVLLEEGAVQRVLVLDLDVHQGDGTAVCLQNDPRIFTLSVHAQSNFPARKQRSSRDVGLPDGTADGPYLSCVAEELTSALTSFRPDLVLYDAGVDVHEADALGRLSISDVGLQRREALVLDTCLAAGVPVAGYVGGGYDDDLEVLAARHCVLHATAQQFWKEYQL